jgi:hypothetical protein
MIFLNIYVIYKYLKMSDIEKVVEEFLSKEDDVKKESFVKEVEITLDNMAKGGLNYNGYLYSGEYSKMKNKIISQKESISYEDLRKALIFSKTYKLYHEYKYYELQGRNLIL